MHSAITCKGIRASEAVPQLNLADTVLISLLLVSGRL